MTNSVPIKLGVLVARVLAPFDPAAMEELQDLGPGHSQHGTHEAVAGDWPDA